MFSQTLQAFANRKNAKVIKDIIFCFATVPRQLQEVEKYYQFRAELTKEKDDQKHKKEKRTERS